MCLDAATGKEVYSGRLSKGAGFYASPLVADGKIYCVSRFSGTFVLAAGRTFKELAHNTFADDDSRTNAFPDRQRRLPAAADGSVFGLHWEEMTEVGTLPSFCHFSVPGASMCTGKSQVTVLSAT